MATGLQIFLKLDGIEGESTDSRHPKEIDVLSCSDGLSQPSPAPAGAGERRPP